MPNEQKNLYRFIAKIAGDFLPERMEICDCVIIYTPSYSSSGFDQISNIRNESSEKHQINKGVTSYVQYPQSSVCVRNFQSDFIIYTDVSTFLVSHAESEARERFERVITALDVNAKQINLKHGKMRLSQRHAKYVFEMTECYQEVNKNWISLRKDIAVNGRYFFKKTIPKHFVSNVIKTLKDTDQVLQKALHYYSESIKRDYTGNQIYSFKYLTLVKVIELIADKVGDRFKIDQAGNFIKSPKGNKIETCMKEKIEQTGKRIKLTKTVTAAAVTSWDFRNKNDIAHKSAYRHFETDSNELENTAAKFIIAYQKYIAINKTS